MTMKKIVIKYEDGKVDTIETAKKMTKTTVLDFVKTAIERGDVAEITVK